MTDGPTALLLVHPAGAALPVWAPGLDVRVVSVDGLDTPTADAAGCALVDATGPAFVSVARRLHALDPSLQVVAVAPPSALQGVRRALLYAPGLGEVWTASPTDVTAALTERAAGVTRQRRRYERTRARLDRERHTESPQRTERALVSDAYLAGLLQVLPDAVFSVDAAGRVLSANAAAERLFGGRGAGTLLGARLAQAIGLDDVAPGGEPDLLARIARDGTLTVRFRTAAGDDAFGELHAVPVGVSARPNGAPSTDVWAVVLHDVTEQQVANDQLRDVAMELESQAEELHARTLDAEVARAEAERARAEAETANRVKADFLATMSHELRTPLNAIGGYTQLMELGIRGPVTAQQRRDLQRIQHSQRHLLGLVNEVLNYARIETGTVRYEVADVPLAELIVSVEPLIAPQIAARRLAFSHHDCGATPLVARADREKVRQVLVNLLSNAVKFTEPPGQVDVSCAAEGDRVMILVHDTGAGIPPDKLDDVFEPFVQVNSSLTRPHQGTGLGLAISRDLARGMGGDLTVQSTVGVGSTFVLTLPRA